MKATPEDLVQLSEQLRGFLIEAGWREGRQARGVTFFYPPQSLGIQGKFSIALPENAARPGVGPLLHGATNSLIEIYGYASLGDLLNRAASLSDMSGPTRFISRFLDATTGKGAMPLTSLASYVSYMEAGLYRGAKFKLGADNRENRLIAEQFVKDCLFLQTAQGSFVAKIEIPHTVLRQPDLFGAEPLISTEVCSSLFSAIQFLNERILGDDLSFESQQILGDVITLFDVELLESLTKVVLEPSMETIEFSLQVGTQVRTSSTGWLSDEKRNRLKDFLDFIRDQLRGENDLDISGSIVELRSRDPEGNKNYIRVESIFHGDRTFISAALSNEQYQRALDAHRNKRVVRLRGNGIRLKTQVRLREITEFTT
ncbi:MAG: hypothetical protein HGA47_00045 [Zoogloea sp.]|nr:hypothetical protein [Zoogloea sp.]